MATKLQTTVAFTQQGDLLYYQISGRDWGRIILDPSLGLICCYTSYGSYNFRWSSPGSDFRKFLTQINYGYAMGKFLGAREVLDIDATIKRLKADVRESRRDGGLTKEEAQECYEAIASCADYDQGAFMQALSQTEYTTHFPDWWEMGVYHYGSDAVGFWKNMWTPLVRFLKKQLAAPTTNKEGGASE